MNKLWIALVALSIVSCTDETKAERTLRVSGYTDIQLTGYSAFMCGKDDDTCTGFKARAPHGEWVTGAVGCGYIGKGCTVRL